MIWNINRWGELIYETTDYFKPWDGRTKKSAPEIVKEDVYVYKFMVTEADNLREHVFYGHLTLIR